MDILSVYEVLCRDHLGQQSSDCLLGEGGGMVAPNQMAPEDPVVAETAETPIDPFFQDGDHFRDARLSLGGSEDAMELFRSFRGRDADMAPLLQRLGLN